jgi:hypothetical protein
MSAKGNQLLNGQINRTENGNLKKKSKCAYLADKSFEMLFRGETS